MTDLGRRDRIDDQAAEWAARTAIGDMTAMEESELEAWLAADRRHDGAYLRARAAYFALEEAALASPIPTASNDDEPLRHQGATRRARRIVGIGLSAAAAAAVLVYAVPHDRSPVPVPNSSRTMALADGSSVELAKGSEISTAMDGASRRITLKAGEATFHVARDSRRPFIVRSGDVFAEATGTVYSVRRVAERGGAVRVFEGSVRVWAEGQRDAAKLVQAGKAITLDPAVLDGSTASSPASLWFEQTTITEAARRFNQVNRTRIEIGDPAIGKVTIMGKFRRDRPDEFAKAAAALTGAHVSERGDKLVIERK